MPKQDVETSEFFVGYAPTPTRLRRDLRLYAIVLIAVVVIAAITVSMYMRDPGNGKWALNDRKQTEGTFLASPYPMLALPGGTVHDTQVLLVVNQGKIAAPSGRELHGRRVRVEGYSLARLGQRMFELADKENPIQVIEDVPSVPDLSELITPPGTPGTFEGEIIDPKCFLGAMKPGDGKAHKACAALCLRGGIPPMFWRQTPGGINDELYLLTGPDLSPLAGQTLEQLIPFVADSVQIQAGPRRIGTLSVLELVSGSIRRR